RRRQRADGSLSTGGLRKTSNVRCICATEVYEVVTDRHVGGCRLICRYHDDPDAIRQRCISEDVAADYEIAQTYLQQTNAIERIAPDVEASICIRTGIELQLRTAAAWRLPWTRAVVAGGPEIVAGDPIVGTTLEEDRRPAGVVRSDHTVP